MVKRNVSRNYVRRATFVGISTVMIVLGGCLTLLLQGQQVQNILADSSTVVGASTLPAATVDAIFRRYGSPMAGTGQVVEQAARQSNIDDAFALAVWYTETTDGEAGVGLADRNPGSVRGSTGYPAAFDGYTIYPSYAAAIVAWFQLINARYVSSGLTSVYTIAHPYVGTSSSGQWAAKVMNLMARYRGEAPPSGFASTPSPAPRLQPFRPSLPAHKGGILPSHISIVAPMAPPVKTQPSEPHPVNQGLPVQAIIQSKDASFSAGSTPAVVGCLLLALALALWGVWLQRRRTAITAPLSPVWSATRPERAEPTTEHFAFPNMQQLSFSGQPIREPDAMPAPAAAGSGSWSSRYQVNEGRPHHLMLEPYEEEVCEAAGNNEERQPATEGLIPLPGVLVPVRKPELVSRVRAGGLLRRYIEEQ